MNKKFTGISLASFLASCAGIVISFLLLKEDVISTAHTVFEYFPLKYGVTPSTTWDGAFILGLFITVLQIVSASVAFSERFSVPWRALAGVSLLASGIFDNWTDIVFRSGNLTGDMRVAVITTLAFYTFGSEITQGLSWLVFMSSWRKAISDLMFGWASFTAGVDSIGGEWKRISQEALKKEYGQIPPHQQPQQKHLEPDKKVTSIFGNPNRYQRFDIHKKR